MRTLNHQVDLCVVGGGLAGLCAAVSAARHGIKVAIMQDRPVFGGNSSSEIRMWVCGARGKDNRETGIIEEMILDNHYRNTSLSFSIWDSVLYEKALLEENLQVIMNCSCLDAEMDGNKIVSVKGWQTTTQTFHIVKATYFADCSGDSILAPLSGAEHTYGRESKRDYNETIPPDERDLKTMGMSCLMQFRETDHKCEFIPPKWAYQYTDDSCFKCKRHDKEENYWWIEVGGLQNCIDDTEELKDELLKIAFGVIDHIKNHGDHGMDNWELDWVGFLPGKRESRRYIGKHVVTQNDVETEGKFYDIVGYGGWTMDDHFPEGFYYQKGETTIFHPAPSPWGIPFRALCSKNIENLMFAGRNISVTHAALSSSRVMATCAVLGQALGTAAALMVNSGTDINGIDIKELQRQLMFDDCYLPFMEREVSPLTLKAKTNAEIVRNGKDRGEENLWKGNAGDSLVYEFDSPELVEKIRIIFDSDLNRKYHNMPCRFDLVEKNYRMPKTMVKEYAVKITDENGNVSEIHVKDNCQRLVFHEIGKKVKKIELVPFADFGGTDEMRVFSFELV
ncbi:FAD-dependent oxidoreductase [Congzhengia minquanensis]|uniref:FAD-dependent oxidoreductase n=1 Tax=Congzhengia minquanensis TaxID=2763657 RepID=A0A926HYU4_9FIRM|nr:FAD-dependent oxidoreductase [Congzhengia minquanensis]MBC8540500.1 FAD-dependent oxidoreductase [Congzhengia minquanensis]